MNKTQIKRDFSSGGVVWDKAARKFLLIRVENLAGQQVWTFPKGHPAPGETDQEAAVREVLEETGWRCAVAKTITDVHYVYMQENVRYQKTVRWFMMSPVEKAGEFDPIEVLECRWVSPEEARSLVSYGSDKELLKQTALLL